MDNHYLTPGDKRRIVELYEGRLAIYGYDVRTIGWGSRADQALRFEVLSRGLNLNKKRILDVGCGLGDFAEFLFAKGFSEYSYMGVDVAPKLVEEANRRFGASNCSFRSLDILDDHKVGVFDIVVCSGALSFKVANNVLLAKKMLAKMYELSQEATCVNFLSSHVDFKLDKNYHYDPSVIQAHASTLSRWTRLYHDYPLYEFTIQILRQPDSAVHSTGGAELI